MPHSAQGSLDLPELAARAWCAVGSAASEGAPEGEGIFGWGRQDVTNAFYYLNLGEGPAVERAAPVGWVGFSTSQDFNGDIALIARFASSWTPAMVRRWHANPFGFLRPWDEVPALIRSAPPSAPPSTGTGVVTFLTGSGSSWPCRIRHVASHDQG